MGNCSENIMQEDRTGDQGNSSSMYPYNTQDHRGKKYGTFLPLLLVLFLLCLKKELFFFIIKKNISFNLKTPENEIKNI